jgi:hypothetical protein
VKLKKNLYTCCEQVGRRGKDYEMKQGEKHPVFLFSFAYLMTLLIPRIA